MSDSESATESMKYEKARKKFLSRVSQRTRSRSSGSQKAVGSEGGICAPTARNKLKRGVGKLSTASASQDCAREHKRRKLPSFGNKNAVKDPMIRIIDESEFRNNNICSSSVRGSSTLRKNVNISTKKPHAFVSHQEGNDNEDSASEEIRIIDKNEFRSPNSSKGISKASIYVLGDASNLGTSESSAGYCDSFSPQDAFCASIPAPRSFTDTENDSGDKIHKINDEAAGFRNQQIQHLESTAEQALCSNRSCKDVGGARKNTSSPAHLSPTRLRKKANKNKGMSCRNTKMKSSSTTTSKRGRGGFVRKGYSAVNSSRKNAAKDSPKKHAGRSRLFTKTEVNSDEEDVDPEEDGIMEIDEAEFRNRKQVVEGHLASTSANKTKVSSYSESKRKDALLYVEMSSSSGEFVSTNSSSEISSDDVTISLPDVEVKSCGHGMNIGVASRTRSKMGITTKPAVVCNVSPSLSTDSDSDSDSESTDSDDGIRILGSNAEACHVQNNQSMEASAEEDEDCSKQVGGAVEHASDQSHLKESDCKQPAHESQKFPSRMIQLRDDASRKPEEDEEEKLQAAPQVNCKQPACSSLQQNGCGEVNIAKELRHKEQSQAEVRRSKKADHPSHSKKDYDQSDEGMVRPKRAYLSSRSKINPDRSDAEMEIPKKADVSTGYDQSDAGMGGPKKADVSTGYDQSDAGMGGPKKADVSTGYDQSDAGMGGPKKVDLPEDDYDQSDDEDDDTQKTTEATSSGGKSEPYDLCSVLADVVLGKGQMPEKDSIKGDEENHVEFPPSPTSQTQDPLPLKFRFEDEVQEPVELTAHEKDMAKIFAELDYNWAMDEHKPLEPPQANLENETSPSNETQHERCSKGRHELVVEDDQGLICLFCRHVVLGPKDVMPDWVERPYHDSARRRYSETEQALEFDEVCLQSSVDNIAAFDATGTVWSIKPGVRKSMYEHQREGFEFLWKNLAGSINLEEVKCSNPSRVGGCIISHAPGTGKSLLTLIFVETYLKVFPNCRPVIIGPASMLLTWEEEFKKWKVGYPFLNLSNSELSVKDKSSVGSLTPAKSRDKSYIRMIKIFNWSLGGSILGISYSLFGKLTGLKYNAGEANKKIRQILLEKPGLVILDEGHTPRNQRSNIWNSLLNLETQKRVILSGTPFQNNFTELFNTLRIVRPTAADGLAQEKTYAEMVGRKKSSRRKHSPTPLNTEVVDRALDKLKSCMEPFVHVHRGTILQQSLPGLRDCVVLLKPSTLQKSLIESTEGANNFKLEHEIALISVHPYLFLKCAEAQRTGIDMEAVKASKLNPLEGVKTRFVLELARLCMASKEKVLVFSQYIQPLELIMKQLEVIFKWVDGRQILRMKGKIEQKQRQVLIKLFNDPNSESRIMLASTKCCSEGISLVGASRVVLLDVVWNPSVERQAISRAYRIGQKKFVYTYHLMTSGTTEADKYCRQAEKERVSELVFSSANEEKHIPLDMEDRILKVMLDKEALKGMFDKIINQPKETDLIESFGLTS